MLAFHGDKAISGPDAMCLAAIKRGMLCVDVESGKAWSVRFANNEVGCTNAGGYRVFTLHLDGKRAQVKIHRLIWLAAQGAIPDGLVIDHKNRIKTDNRLCNLRLVDAAGNSQNRRSYRGERNPAAVINRETANAIRAAKGSYSQKAKAFGVSKSLIAQISRRELWV